MKGVLDFSDQYLPGCFVIVGLVQHMAAAGEGCGLSDGTGLLGRGVGRGK